MLSDQHLTKYLFALLQVLIQNPTVRILNGHKDRHAISIEGDEAVTDILIEGGYKVYIPEFILMGVLRQQMDWESTPHCLGR
jgi:mediator of DNA damage checkpoint protein 1